MPRDEYLPHGTLMSNMLLSSGICRSSLSVAFIQPSSNIHCLPWPVAFIKHTPSSTIYRFIPITIGQHTQLVAMYISMDHIWYDLFIVMLVAINLILISSLVKTNHRRGKSKYWCSVLNPACVKKNLSKHLDAALMGVR